MLNLNANESKFSADHGRGTFVLISDDRKNRSPCKLTVLAGKFPNGNIEHST